MMAAEKGYRNPILPGFHPDPSVCVVGNTYYLATSTFEYFPGVPIYSSTDLVSWRLLGHALNRRSQLDLRTVEPSAGIFAPTLRYHKARGRWYMTTCAAYRFSGRTAFENLPFPRGFYVWTDNIADETRWSDPVWFDTIGIDQDLFFDDDGKTYHSFATQEPGIGDVSPIPGKYNLSCYTVPIDLDSGDSLAPATLVRRNRSTSNWVAEGPHILKRGAWYYLLTAEGGTEVAHQEWVSRSRSPLGPWETPNAGQDDDVTAPDAYLRKGSPSTNPPPVGPGKDRHINPLIYNGDDPHVQMTGHMDMAEAPDGRWWAFCLAVRPQDGRLSQLGRETFLMPVEWVDDWPVINSGKKVAVDGDAGCGLERVSATEKWEYSFNPNMSLTAEGWYNLRTPQKPFASLTSHPGALAIRGGPYALDVDENVTMLLKKQTAFTGRWEVEFGFNPRKGEAAGVAVWWSKWCYGAVFLRGNRDGVELVFRIPEGDGFTETVHPAPTCPLQVRIDARPDGYNFSVGEKEVGVLPATKLVQNRAWDSIMTGTFLALFAHGAEYEGCLSPAVFRRVSWDGVLGDN